MTIVRVGLSETKHYGEGWSAIFAKKKPGKPAKTPAARRKTAKTRKKK